MPSSAVQIFSDPDDYAASIRGATVTMTVTAPGRFSAKRTRIDLHQLRMQQLSETVPRIGHFAFGPGRTGVSFCAEPGPACFLSSGLEVQSSRLFRRSSADYFQQCATSAKFAMMSLTVEDMAAIGDEVAKFDLTPPRDAMLVSPPRSAMARLRRLHAAAAHLAEEAPEIIANPDSARGLEQALIEAMVGCLDPHDRRESTLAQGQHAIVIRRFRRMMEERVEQPLYLPEISRAIGVSPRTLEICCREHLGMGPKRYLQLRRMHLARRALVEGRPEATTVTEIATRFGFWQFGRFAAEYRSLFGESPNVTLRRERG